MIRKARISRKLLMISLTYSLPIAVMVCLIISGINKDITFARMEHFGDEYQRPLEQLLQSVPRHGLLAHAVLSGDARLQDQLNAEQARVDKAVETLDAVDRRLGTTLQFTDEALAKRKRETARVSSVRSQWQG